MKLFSNWKHSLFMSPDTCTNCATHSQWKILDKKRQVTAPLTLQTSFISGTRCRFHDWFLLRLEIVEVCPKYPLRSQQCPSSIKLSPTRLYVYLSQYLGLDKRPTDHFIPQTTHLTNLTICTWFTAVNDISLGRKTLDAATVESVGIYISCVCVCCVLTEWPGHRSGQPTHDKG